MTSLHRPVFSPSALCELELQPHPASHCPDVQSIGVQLFKVESATGVSLLLRYRVMGRISQLKLPPPASHPGQADELWRHTCCEFFVAKPGAKSYREFNFSPSGQWAIYGFADERLRDAEAITESPPALSFRNTEDEFTLEAELPWPAWSLDRCNGHLHAGLTAVIEARDGSLSYWALHHPSEKPDFHRRAGWTLKLNT